MKVLYLQNIDGVAGSEKYFLALIPELIKKGVDVHMYCVVKFKNKYKAKEFTDLLIEANIPFTVQYVKSYGTLKIPYQLNKYVKKNGTDIKSGL